VLDIEDRSEVTVVRFRHGKVNALDLELLKAITAAVRGVDDDRAVVLTGTGGAFSAGVDLRRIVDGGPAPTSGSSCLPCPRPSWLSSIIPGRW
jgi:enoyl-CoA hydratase